MSTTKSSDLPGLGLTHEHPHSAMDEKGSVTPDSASDDPETVAATYGISEKHLVRKLDRHLLPGVCVLYLLSFLDRSNVANARLEGLTTDLGITGNEYLTGTLLKGRIHDPFSKDTSREALSSTLSLAHTHSLCGQAISICHFMIFSYL